MPNLDSGGATPRPFGVRLLADWKWVVTKAWSSRLLMVAAGLSGIEAVLSVYVDNPPIPREAFALLIFLVTVAALVARTIAQR